MLCFGNHATISKSNEKSRLMKFLTYPVFQKCALNIWNLKTLSIRNKIHIEQWFSTFFKSWSLLILLLFSPTPLYQLTSRFIVWSLFMKWSSVAPLKNPKAQEEPCDPWLRNTTLERAYFLKAVYILPNIYIWV